MSAAAGEDTYILYCATHPVRAVVGLVDSSRISSDVFRGGVRNGMDQILRSFDLNNRWFAVDADCYYLAPDVQGAGKVQGGWPMIRTYVSMMGLSCGAAFTSDLWQWDGFKPYWRMTEILTPPGHERTEVLDLGTSETWPRLLSTVHRPWGDSHVALLWNPAKDEQAITLEFAKAGLEPAHRYAVWSFWDDKFLGIAKGKWTTPALPVGSCQHLCLTDLDRQPGRPILIGSNLHIFCGAAEIKNFKYMPNEITIDLTDAGALEGDLFIYSRKPLVIQSGMATVPVSKWSNTIDTYIRALLVARNKDAEKPDLLFALGFPEVIDEYDAIDLITDHQRRVAKLDKIYQKEESALGKWELGCSSSPRPRGTSSPRPSSIAPPSSTGCPPPTGISSSPTCEET